MKSSMVSMSPAGPSVHYACMTEYDERFTLPVAFPPLRMEGLFHHALADAEKTCPESRRDGEISPRHVFF